MSITIKIKDNGPYLISLEDAASVVIVDSAGRRQEPTLGKAIALCRCGHSSRKPFCDGTHRTVGFQGALAVPVVVAVPAAAGAPVVPVASAQTALMPAAESGHGTPAAPSVSAPGFPVPPAASATTTPAVPAALAAT